MLCYDILLYSACPNTDTFSIALYKKNLKLFTLKILTLDCNYNTTLTIICLHKMWVFSILLNSLSVVAFLMAAGNVFHSFGPDIANDLSRKVLHLLVGILSNLLPLDLVSFSNSSY